jgi:hypothetical protein
MRRGDDDGDDVLLRLSSLFPNSLNVTCDHSDVSAKHEWAQATSKSCAWSVGGRWCVYVALSANTSCANVLLSNSAHRTSNFSI